MGQQGQTGEVLGESRTSIVLKGFVGLGGQVCANESQDCNIKIRAAVGSKY